MLLRTIFPGNCKLALLVKPKEANFFLDENTTQNFYHSQSSVSRNNDFQSFAISAIEQGVQEKRDSFSRPFCVNFTILILLRKFSQTNGLFHYLTIVFF